MNMAKMRFFPIVLLGELRIFLVQGQWIKIPDVWVLRNENESEQLFFIFGFRNKCGKRRKK